MRRIVSLLLTALMFAAGTPAASAQGSSAVVVDGDPLVRIVTSVDREATPMAAGLDGLYHLKGDDWTRVADAPPAGDVLSDGTPDGVMLAGDAPSCMKGGAPVELQRSDDGGRTWTPVDEVTGYRPLAIWSEQELALASSCEGLHLSTDLGLTWAPVPGVDPGWDLTAFADVTAGDGPVVLVGLTSEGGTTFLHRIDFADPTSPVVSDVLREYYAIGGLAGSGDTWLQTAMDGAWLTTDAGVTWERLEEGLDGLYLDRDPLEVGLPQDFDPSRIGIPAAALIPGTSDGFVIGTANGVYVKAAGDDAFVAVEGTGGRVEQVVVPAEGDIVYLVDDQVMTARLP